MALLAIGTGCGEDRTRNDPATKEPPVATLRLLDLKEHPVDPWQVPDAKAVVLVFVGIDCPISNRCAPEVNRLHARFAPQQVVFRMVYLGTNDSAEALSRHLHDYDLPGQPFRDPRLAVARHIGIRVTPEAAVFLPGGRMAYHGRIDDRFADYGKERPTPTRHDLEDALLEILQGRPVSNPHQVAVGCPISGLP